MVRWTAMRGLSISFKYNIRLVERCHIDHSLLNYIQYQMPLPQDRLSKGNYSKILMEIRLYFGLQKKLWPSKPQAIKLQCVFLSLKFIHSFSSQDKYLQMHIISSSRHPLLHIPMHNALETVTLLISLTCIW